MADDANTIGVSLDASGLPINTFRGTSHGMGGNWVELPDEWEIRSTEQGQSGTRAFLQVAAGEVSSASSGAQLPRIGEQFQDQGADPAPDEQYKNCRCRSVTATKCQRTTRRKLVFHYSTDDFVDDYFFETSQQVDLSKVSQAMDITGEFLSWKQEGTSKPVNYVGGGDVDVAIHKVIPSIHWSTRKGIADFNTATTAIIAALGCVNASAISSPSFEASTVLFLGAKLTPYRNEDGDKRWACELKFAARKVTGLGATGTITWNHVFSKNGEWKAVTPPIYATADLTVLFNLK